jgi:hypothetical protein
VLWALSVFNPTADVFVAQSNLPIFIVVGTTFVPSIVLPILFSIHQRRMLLRLKEMSGNGSDSEDNDSTAPLALLEDHPALTATAASRPTSSSSTATGRTAGTTSPPPALSATGTSAAALSTSNLVSSQGTTSGATTTATAGTGPVGPWVPAAVDERLENGSQGSSSKKKSTVSRNSANKGTPIPARTPASRLFSITLVNDVLRTAFQRYCMESWCIENYLFYRDAVKFRTMHSMFLAIEAQRMATAYLPTDSTLAVNLTDDVRARILARLQAGDVRNDLYEEAEYAVLEFMRNDTFLKWRITDAFAQAWREANIPPAMLVAGKPVSALSDQNVSRLVVELGSASQASGRALAPGAIEAAAA